MRDTQLFGDTKLSDLLEEIHGNSSKKRKDIDAVIKQLVQMMKDPTDASQLLPLIKDLYEVGVKNDEQVVKIATIAQRLISADAYQKGSGETGDILSEQEKDALINNAFSDMGNHLAGIDSKIELAKRTIEENAD